MVINRGKFKKGHDLFKKHMLRNSEKGESFVDFNHDFILRDEIIYKRRVLKEGRKALNLGKWGTWVNSKGKIINAVKGACEKSENLLGAARRQKFGDEHAPEAPLYLVKKEEEVVGLEQALFDFLKGGRSSKDKFGPRFDEFRIYLRKHKLGVKWAFLAYLAFLLNDELYIPFIPSFIDRLFRFYEIDREIKRKIRWDNYLFVLDVADELKGYLSYYGELDSIEIQSYMWVVSYLVDGYSKTDVDKERKIAEKARKYASKAERDVLIGWEGEEIVVKSEIRKLKGKRKTSLANKVKHVSIEKDDLGYDVLSFKPDGEEIHIEVKSTLYPEPEDPGFWLSEPERLTAEEDPYWRLYRVYLVKPKPVIKDFGNIVLKPLSGWDKKTASWRFFKTN